MNVKRLLSARIEAALKDCGVQAPALVKTASRPEYGHYQADGVMAAAKTVKANPRQLAAEVINRLNADDMAQTVEVAGPGFLNIRLGDQFLASKLDLEAPLIDKADRSQTVVVDYSCPNLAKEMHVGHLRSTIIGD
ncbi:MAG: arginine--tRNA ligase, partial [Gammaproteobacteria bacterium]|nr:arginine--tRNA ligase [Gammaproteobacteria bacterium]